MSFPCDKLIVSCFLQPPGIEKKVRGSVSTRDDFSILSASLFLKDIIGLTHNAFITVLVHHIYAGSYFLLHTQGWIISERGGRMKIVTPFDNHTHF